VPRLATLVAVLLFAFPAAAFAQGAGDDQYQDPFGDQPSQSSGSGGGSTTTDSGLSTSPPVAGAGSSGSGSSGSSAPSAPPVQTPVAGASASRDLPRTGSEPLVIMMLGLAFLLTGIGLRLRTIDPDAF
jgi:hypothetical protein